MKAEKTREIIANSLYQLMTQYYFEDITVNMICTEAGVGRTTFYRFFRDKYDVLVIFFEINYQEISRKYPDAKDYLMMMTEYFCLIRKYDSFFRKALSITGQNSLMEYIYQGGYDYYVRQAEKREGRSITEQERMSIVMFTSGMVALINDWIRTGFATEPHELALVAYESMPQWLGRCFVPEV